MTFDLVGVTTLKEAVSQATKVLGSVDVDNPVLDARLLLAHAIGDTQDVLMRAPDQVLSARQITAFQNLIERRLKREPVSHLLGTRGFWNSDFFVNRHVLDPRPDSETLIETVLHRMPDRTAPCRILDLGTGSGCLLLSLLQEIPQAEGVGVDKSEAALEIAGKNVAALGLTDRCQLRNASWFDGLSGQFDIIISNPPYIETMAIKNLQAEIRDFEPRSALDGGADGFECYTAILDKAADFMMKDGLLAFEVGIGQAGILRQKMLEAGCQDIEITPDLAGIARVVSGFRKN